MTVATDETGRGARIDDLGRRLRFSPELAAKLYDLLTPGATVIVTDHPAVRRGSGISRS